MVNHTSILWNLFITVFATFSGVFLAFNLNNYQIDRAKKNDYKNKLFNLVQEVNRVQNFISDLNKNISKIDDTSNSSEQRYKSFERNQIETIYPGTYDWFLESSKEDKYGGIGLMKVVSKVLESTYQYNKQLKQFKSTYVKNNKETLDARDKSFKEALVQLEFHTLLLQHIISGYSDNKKLTLKINKEDNYDQILEWLNNQEFIEGIKEIQDKIKN